MKRKLILIAPAGVLILTAIVVLADRDARREARAARRHLVVTQEGQIKLVPTNGLYNGCVILEGRTQ